MTCCARWIAVGCAALLGACDFGYHVERVAFVGPEFDAAALGEVLARRPGYGEWSTLWDGETLWLAWRYDRVLNGVYYSLADDGWHKPDCVAFGSGRINGFTRQELSDALAWQDEVFEYLLAELPAGSFSGGLVLTAWNMPDESLDDLKPGPLLEEKP